MANKTSTIQESDQTARKPIEDLDSEREDTTGEATARITSAKSGKHSTAEKQGASRPEFAGSAKGRPHGGAFGKPVDRRAKGSAPRASFTRKQP